MSAETIRRYAHSIGDDNPLYTYPDYGRTSVYGSQIAPGPILVHVRYPADHGARRPGGYPVANFLAGVAWEFFDVVRPGARFSSSKIPREAFEKPGRHGRLLFLVSETSYWDQGGALVAKAYGSLIHVPMEAMAAGRAMSADRVGRDLLYSRKPHRYDDDEMRRIADAVSAERRRGANPRWWEDVRIGDVLPAIAQPPYVIEDELAYHAMHQGMFAGTDGSRAPRAFRPFFRRGRMEPGAVRVHPATRWPYNRADEHEDGFLAPYRGEPLPFDYGVQRAQIPQRLLTNWIGDSGFIRKMYTSFREPVFYGDSVLYTGTVLRKDTVTERGHGVAGTFRSAVYHAVTVRIEGDNQSGSRHCEGFATMYLPSRRAGIPLLPVPHEHEVPYVSFERHRSESWF